MELSHGLHSMSVHSQKKYSSSTKLLTPKSMAVAYRKVYDWDAICSSNAKTWLILGIFYDCLLTKRLQVQCDALTNMLMPFVLKSIGDDSGWPK